MLLPTPRPLARLARTLAGPALFAGLTMFGGALCVPLTAAPAAAQAPADTGSKLTLEVASARSQQLADTLRSPFCPGKTLLTCTSGQAFTARQEIRDRLMAGESETSILKEFKERYGEQIENPPQPWYTVLGPIAPVALGVAVLLAITWRWRKTKAGDLPSGPVAAPADGGGDADRLARLRRQIQTEDD